MSCLFLTKFRIKYPNFKELAHMHITTLSKHRLSHVHFQPSLVSNIWCWSACMWASQFGLLINIHDLGYYLQSTLVEIWSLHGRKSNHKNFKIQKYHTIWLAANITSRKKLLKYQVLVIYWLINHLWFLIQSPLQISELAIQGVLLFLQASYVIWSDLKEVYHAIRNLFDK